ncbi:MAG: cytochrome P450, partial [Anaerolineales bacterium]|nr:cytochrome P450 [Anaerolineales bacterium]
MTHQSPPPEKHDLFSPTFKADPFPTFATMRANEPVYCHVAPYGARIWYITRYEDVLEVLKDNTRFAKDPRNVDDEQAAVSLSNKNIFQNINQNMLFADPPDHTRLRTLVSQAFTPRRVEVIRPRIQAIAHDLLDRIEAQGMMDLIADYAFPLPVTVIMEMLGVPAADQEQVHDWSKVIIAPGRYGISLKIRKRKIRAFVNYLHAMFADRRHNPQDDLITDLVQAEESGDTLSESELSSMVALLFVTGHETVVNLIGNGTLALLQHPAELEKLKQNPDLIDRTIEELLRYDGPVETSTTRWAREDMVLHGQTIRKGDVVRVVMTSANRDAAVFEEP